MLNRLCVLLMILATTAPAFGQDDGVIHMTPEFPLIFPLDQNGQVVSVKYPVLINPATIIKPGMILRIIYVLRSANPDGSTDLILAHRGSMENAYSRSTASTSDVSKMPPEMAHEIEGYRRDVWEVANNFVLAMAQYPTDAMHLIYSPTGKNQDIDDERFSFFDGLFVGLPDGKVTVIAVEKESKAASAGIKAGDEILAVSGASTKNDLATFATAYAAAKDRAKANEMPNYTLTIRSPDHPDVRTVNIAMPPSFKSDFLNSP